MYQMVACNDIFEKGDLICFGNENLTILIF
jgi:hypothetical protein